MNEFLEKMVSRLSKYDWFTTLIPGLFLFALSRRIGIDLTTQSLVEEFGIILFLGVVSSRIGATCIEQIARWCGLFEPYEDYIAWSNANKNRSDILVRNLNWYRSLCGMVLSLVGMLILKCIPRLGHYCKLWIVICSLLLIFCDSYRRQVLFIAKRIEKFKKEMDKTEE